MGTIQGLPEDSVGRLLKKVHRLRRGQTPWEAQKETSRKGWKIR